MTVLPGLTTTEKERIPRFVSDLRSSTVRAIALFPTVLTRDERYHLYGELSRIDGLQIPHVHLRTDFDDDEIRYVIEQFNTELFNIHPDASTHPFGPVPAAVASRVFVENVDVAATDEEIGRLGGICPDYSHLENARLQDRTDYVSTTESQLRRYPIGCCHVSAIRPGDRNPYNGGFDHHNFRALSDLDYMERYAWALPGRWVSLELENRLAEQLEAAAYLIELLGRASTAR
ncbi:MAG: hypothetical protein ACOC1U_04915 [Spirochaetota bacterium]